LVEALLLVGQAGLIALILEQALVGSYPVVSLQPMLAGLAGVALGRALVIAARGMLAERASATIRQELRTRLVRRLCLSDPARDSEFQTGALAHQVVDRVDRLEPYFSRFLPQQYAALLIPLLIVLTVAWINWLAGLVLAIAAPIIPAFMALIGLGAERLSRDQAIVTARLSGLFHDRLRGLSTIQRFGASDRVVEWLTEAAQDYRERTMKVLRLAFLSSAVLEFFAAVAIASLAIYIGLSLLGFIDIGPSNHLTLASGLFILLLAPDFFLALRQLAQHWHDRADALAAAADLRPLFDRPSVAQPNAAAPRPTLEHAPALRIESLSFGYPGKARLFDRLELDIQAGERLLITGPSGCGKSTLLMLMAGLARPEAGRIGYGGQDIARMDDRALSRQRAWLNQNSVIFDRSLRENLTLGRSGFDDQALNDLLELCGLSRLASELEQGLETPLGNDGARLSGGQARRIALARTLLEPRPILLLDEPSEHLDRDSEEALWTAIEWIGNQRPMTVIAVSHRPRARQWARRIVDLAAPGPSRETVP
jgi:ATP-binding cassette subfamily C protein CydD